MSQTEAIFAINAVLVFVIQHLKLSQWFPWITLETQKVNRILSAVLATLASAGIVFTFAHPEPGHYILDIAGLTLTSVVNFVATAIVNFMSQKLMFKVAYSNGNGKAV